ncbi:MAG: hypothetical protein JSW73_00045 [Candidatus Woesearchaeota archaeon]|nr:MAG: hypothetical protein JSW73_00045 [Candidatus Woesearchaeota archaeon]
MELTKEEDKFTEEEIDDMCSKIEYELSNSIEGDRFTGENLDNIGINENNSKLFLEAILRICGGNPNIMLNCGSYGEAKENYFKGGASEKPPSASIEEVYRMAYWQKKEHKPADDVVLEIRDALHDNEE